MYVCGRVTYTHSVYSSGYWAEAAFQSFVEWFVWKRADSTRCVLCVVWLHALACVEHIDKYGEHLIGLQFLFCILRLLSFYLLLYLQLISYSWLLNAATKDVQYEGI